jgi:hypothetical protein
MSFSFLENYHLHGRVRMKIEQMLYSKLLRSYDASYVLGQNFDISGSERKKKLQVSMTFSAILRPDSSGFDADSTESS